LSQLQQRTPRSDGKSVFMEILLAFKNFRLVNPRIRGIIGRRQGIAS
jgi:hypothetical protein